MVKYTELRGFLEADATEQEIYIYLELNEPLCIVTGNRSNFNFLEASITCCQRPCDYD